MNSTLTGVSTQISENRIATAANFVGKTVLVPGNVAMVDDTGAISGAVDLPSDATSLQLQITKSTGEIVKTIDLGANPTGLVGFQWDGKDANKVSVGESSYLVKAIMTSGGKQTSATTDVYSPVTEAMVPATGDVQTLRVSGVGVVKMSDVRAFKY